MLSLVTKKKKEAQQAAADEKVDDAPETNVEETPASPSKKAASPAKKKAAAATPKKTPGRKRKAEAEPVAEESAEQQPKKKAHKRAPTKTVHELQNGPLDKIVPPTLPFRKLINTCLDEHTGPPKFDDNGKQKREYSLSKDGVNRFRYSTALWLQKLAADAAVLRLYRGAAKCQPQDVKMAHWMRATDGNDVSKMTPQEMKNMVQDITGSKVKVKVKA